MGPTKRFRAPNATRVILSWRLAIGVVTVGVLVGVGAGVMTALVGGSVSYAVSVLLAMVGRRPTEIDPFTLGEPWRQIVQRSQAAGRAMRATVESAEDGPLRTSLLSIADELDRGLAVAYEAARRGDEIDDMIRKLDPSGLRSDLATAQLRATSAPSVDADAAVESLQRQIESADRLTAVSQETATALRATQTHLDELVARAAEVRFGAIDTDRYRSDVGDLVIRLESLRQAVQEIR